MDSVLQQIIPLLLGGVFIWGTAFALELLARKMKMPNVLKETFHGTAILVMCLGLLQLLVAWALPASQVFGFVAVVWILLILFFLSSFSRKQKIDRAMQNLSQADEQWYKDIDSKLKAIDEKYKM